jgi:hypothetical protein
MKRVCFIEMEGILTSQGKYKANASKTKKFVEEVSTFCKHNQIELFLISGFHEKIAQMRFKKSFLKTFFDKQHFFFVDDKYIFGKGEADAKLHQEKLNKDKEFHDSYFKQVLIQQFLHDNNIKPNEALLLCNDVWVDAYYTTRFSKVDFALFEENITERGNPIKKIEGLRYFDLDSETVKVLLEKFPIANLSALDKFVYEKMKLVLLKNTDFSGVVKKAMEKKQGTITRG